jgi:hypothetical protein
MDWKEVGRSVASAAPALGVALGGPAGGAVGSLIAAAFGADSTPAAVARAVAADPNAAGKLREVELRHAEALAALAAQQYEAQLLDVQQARVAHREHWMPWALTIVLALMVAAMGVGLFVLDTPSENREVVYLLAGQLLGAFATAIAYWLGSSRGSAEKQRQLEAR